MINSLLDSFPIQRPVKAGYAVGSIVALFAVVIIPVHWLVSGSNEYIMLSGVWAAIRLIQVIFTILGARYKKLSLVRTCKECLLTLIYLWRPA
jgi:predicted tellurium resistance membrane protein TerC